LIKEMRKRFEAASNTWWAATIAFALLPASTSLAVGTHAAGSIRMATLHIQSPLDFWRSEGFVQMTPSIHLPTTHSADDLIVVWLYVPPNKKIDARFLDEQSRWSLVFPPGTRSDRVEYKRIGGGKPQSANMFFPDTLNEQNNWTILDVRGTQILAEGQRFHVFRPDTANPHASRTGWSWLRGDREGQKEATTRLVEHAARTHRPGGAAPLDPGGRRMLAHLNDCAHCHIAAMPQRSWQNTAIGIKRETDAHGFFVPQAVLSDDSIVADHRPRDLNSEDPFVKVQCGDDPARLVQNDAGNHFVCDNERVPIGHRDVATALAAGHPYTLRVCASRRWLFERMTARARDAFAPAFRRCGIGESAPESS
jgi:hypothetical protein